MNPDGCDCRECGQEGDHQEKKAEFGTLELAKDEIRKVLVNQINELIENKKALLENGASIEKLITIHVQIASYAHILFYSG